MDVDRSKFAAKWPGNVDQRGFVPVPKCLITCMADLGLKPQEAVVLFNIIERCWKAGDKAWPSVDYFAVNIGRKNSAVREITKCLSEKNFITKEQRYNTTNLYSLEPTAQKLANHMPNCRHSARNPMGGSRKSGSQDSQKTSDYIEPDLTRTNTLESNITSPRLKSGDPISSSINYKRAKCPKSDGYHKWDEYETEKLNDNGKNTIYYYKSCEYCGMTFHKKDDTPFGEKPSRYYATSSEPTELPDGPVNLDDIDWPTNGGQLLLN